MNECMYMWVRTVYSFRTKAHRVLLMTCERTIATGGCMLIFCAHHPQYFTHPKKEFFEIAGEITWECEKVLTERFLVSVCLW